MRSSSIKTFLIASFPATITLCGPVCLHFIRHSFFSDDEFKFVDEETVRIYQCEQYLHTVYVALG